MYGTITFSAFGDPERVAKVSRGYDVGKSESHGISNGGQLPGYDRLQCTIAAPPSEIAKGAGVRMTAALKNYHTVGADDDFSFVLDLPINKWPPAPGQLIGMISQNIGQGGSKLATSTYNTNTPRLTSAGWRRRSDRHFVRAPFAGSVTEPGKTPANFAGERRLPWAAAGGFVCGSKASYYEVVI
jgi:hypothetical protein